MQKIDIFKGICVFSSTWIIQMMIQQEKLTRENKYSSFSITIHRIFDFLKNVAYEIVMNIISYVQLERSII